MNRKNQLPNCDMQRNPDNSNAPISKVRTASWHKMLNQPIILLVKFYRYFISPLLPNTCRFQPTCSQYTLESFQHHSFLPALRLSIIRLSKCHPWGNFGYDPVPATPTTSTDNSKLKANNI